jgi:predicted double-glycine peptidase
MRRCLVCAVLLLGLAAPAMARKPSLVPTRFLWGVPDVRQMNPSACGVACVQAVACAFFGEVYGEEHYWKLLGATQEQGTHPRAIVRGLRKIGLSAEMREGMTIEELRGHIDAGHLVILDFQAWGEPVGKDYAREWEDGHYTVAVGYNDDVIFIEDPSLLGSIGYLTNDELERRWHDYELEGGKRREYVHLGIVVRGRRWPVPRFRHID